MPGHNGGFNPYRDANGQFASGGAGASSKRPSLAGTKAKGTGRGFARTAAGPAAAYRPRTEKSRSALPPADRRAAVKIVSWQRIQAKQRIGKLDNDTALLKAMRDVRANPKARLIPHEQQQIDRYIAKMGG